MIRCRFKTTDADCRPIIWPIKHPYWVSGCGGDEDEGTAYNVLVAYADDEEMIMALWPDAYELESEERTEYVFTDRFQRPDWFKETTND